MVSSSLDFENLKKILVEFDELVPSKRRCRTFLEISGYPHRETVYSNIFRLESRSPRTLQCHLARPDSQCRYAGFAAASRRHVNRYRTQNPLAFYAAPDFILKFIASIQAAVLRGANKERNKFCLRVP